jgi:hypothetical protein
MLTEAETRVVQRPMAPQRNEQRVARGVVRAVSRATPAARVARPTIVSKIPKIIALTEIREHRGL